MSSGGLVSVPLDATTDFNWVFLVELVVTAILFIFFFGYLDRLFATVVSYGIRWYTWRWYKAYIDIRALQISLLGGRIFFKDVRYHAHNVTLLVHSGYITWNYWYRNVRDAEVYLSEPESAPERSASSASNTSPDSASKQDEKAADRAERGGRGNEANRKLPCRVIVRVEGVQAFIYNRSPVYDAIVNSFNRDKQTFEWPDRMSTDSSRTKSDDDDVPIIVESKVGWIRERLRFAWRFRGRKKEGPEVIERKQSTKPDASYGRPPLPFFLKILPIAIDVKTIGAVIGNDNTKCIITAKVQSSTGIVDAGRAGPFDIYKQIFDFTAAGIVARMRPNPDFKAMQLETAVRVKAGMAEENAAKRKAKRKPWVKRNPFTFWKNSSSANSIRTADIDDDATPSAPLYPTTPDTGRWQGLSRYLDDGLRDEHDEWDPIEYARLSTLFEGSRVDMNFFWDIPGTVPYPSPLVESLQVAEADDINGTVPPEYGVNLSVYGGSVAYGPWADRQRINLQSIFLPTNYSDAQPADKLKPGDARVNSVFKIFISIEDEVILRVPIREPSKDHRWKGKADTITAPSKKPLVENKGGKRKRPFWRAREKGPAAPAMRPFAWLDVKVPKDSTVNYVMDMVARRTGFKAGLTGDIRGVEITSSINHGLMFRSGAIGLDCDLSTPIGWNTLREWKFKITNDDSEVFILRDHLFLIIDLVADWTSGPLPEYFTFCPFRYLLELKFRNVKLYLNTNDSNIIDNPSEFDENTFLVLSGREIRGHINIPLINFRPANNEMSFDIEADDLHMDLCLNSRNTVATFTGAKQIAKVNHVTLKGSHANWTTTSPDLTDRLTFFIHGKGVDLCFFGFVVSHLIKLKENYFGDFMHFRTLEEFQELSRGASLDVGDDAKAQQSNRSNDLDVILVITAEDVRAQMPANLYSADENAVAEVAYANVDLRLTNYYLDLQVDISPISLSHNHNEASHDDPHLVGSRTELFIDSLTLVGHRLFGLPPTEPAYVCNWDIEVGTLSGECSTLFLDKLVRSIKCFVFSLDDDENVTPMIPPVIVHDVTFLRVRTQAIKIMVLVDHDAFLVQTDPVTVEFNDWADLTSSQKLKVLAPSLKVACMDAQSASRYRASLDVNSKLETFALIETAVTIRMLQRKLNFAGEREKQQTHILSQDLRTNRASFLLLEPPGPDDPILMQEVDRPAIVYPGIPSPVRSIKSNTVRPDSATSKRSHASSRESATKSLASARQRLKKQRSQASFAASLRAAPKPAPKTGRARAASIQGHPSLASERAEDRRHWQPSSLAMSSQLATPYFPLQALEPDPDDLPPYQTLDEVMTQADIDPEFNDVQQRNMDENLVHTSLLISVNPGIRGFFKPKAIDSIVRLIDVILPKSPENLLDDFQVVVMSELLNLEEKAKGKGKSVDISLRIPQVAIRFLNVFESQKGREVRSEVDQYDLELHNLAATGRVRTYPISYKRLDSNLMHCSLGKLQVAVKERPLDGSRNDAAIRVRVDEVLVWAASTDANDIHTSFRDLEVATASRNLEYLAAMIHRTTVFGESCASKFIDVLATEQARLRYLIYELTMAGAEVQDPPFLTRASFLVRGTSHHLRTHDSWKIISRFRYIYHTMSEQSKDLLRARCIREFHRCPANADAVVINSWESWRQWDMRGDQVRRSLAFRHLYGDDIVDPGDEVVSKSLHVTLRASSIKVIIDPGQRQSVVMILVPIVEVEVSPTQWPTGLMLLEGSYEEPVRKILVHASAGTLKADVKWEVTELVENILSLFRESPQLFGGGAIAKSRRKSSATMSTTEAEYVELQLIMAIGSAAIQLETINLRVLAESTGLRASIIGIDRSSGGGGLAGSAIFNAGLSHSRFHANGRVLLEVSAESPNLFLSREDIGHGALSTSYINITGATKKLSVNLKEEILGVIELVDALIRDEVAHIQGTLIPLINSLPKSEDKKPSKQSLPKLNLALLMDTYRIDLGLLQSLVYTMSGNIGRIAVVPGMRKFGFDLNFDLDEQHHDLVSHARAGLHVVSALRLPSINGEITVSKVEDAISLNVTTIIETIVIEAAALHAIVSTLRLPEVSDTVKAISQDIEVIKSRVRDIYPQQIPEQAPQTNPASGRPLIFNVTASLAGLKVEAEAPGKAPSAGVASLAFGVGAVRVKAFNAVDGGKTILPLPEINAQVRKIYAALSIKRGGYDQPCGNLSLSASIQATGKRFRKGPKRKYNIETNGIEVNIFAETASAVVDVLNHLQDKIKDLDLTRERKYLARLRQPSVAPKHLLMDESTYTEASMVSSGVFTSALAVAVRDIQISWIVGNSVPKPNNGQVHDLVLTIELVELATKSESTSTLAIENVMLQMVPVNQSKRRRHPNSALLPETMFTVNFLASEVDRKLACRAKSESLNLELEPKFIIPASILKHSISLAVDKFKEASASWKMTPAPSGAERTSVFGDKRLSSLDMDFDFAGAEINLRGNNDRRANVREHTDGRYGQFTQGEDAHAKFETPGLAIKIQYKDDGSDSTLNGEIKINASENSLVPNVVPLLLEISESVKTVVAETDTAVAKTTPKAAQPSSYVTDESLLNADPSELLGGTSLNLGLRIASQKFSLSCAPIARVSATASIDEIYITANNIKSSDKDHFFAVSANFENLRASVQHVYSRESTFSFRAESIVLSLMNSKHLSGIAGINAILKINPTTTEINVKQLQDFLLFREIWYPPDLRGMAQSSPVVANPGTQDYLMQRYQQTAAATAFPWNANIAIAEMKVKLDLGSAIGKTELKVTNLWASSRKTSNWEQSLCVGIDEMSITGDGRLSGFVDLVKVNVRTTIAWPQVDTARQKTPRIQASAGFDRLRVKAAFDYQAFGIADISCFTFLMYNVREEKGGGDRLVAILDGDAVQVFCTATSASQGVAVYQAFARLMKENNAAYEQSLSEIEKFLRRQSIVNTPARHHRPSQVVKAPTPEDDDKLKAPISLYTHVVVTLRSINVGAFPSSFSDNQILLLEASDVQARFATMLEEGMIHSGLGMTLGQLRVALAASQNQSAPKPLDDMTVEEVVKTANDARGGVILRVPKVLAAMQCWQDPSKNDIEYIFKSSFEGKVDVGWNYARIGNIRSMWNSHSRSLASRLGKPISAPAVTIKTPEDTASKEEKITATINLPQNKYNYYPREPPIVDTPQLRDMGEATPPLEWIGLHRERLPNVVHQIVIQGLLGVAKEVEDAYGKILGSS